MESSESYQFKRDPKKLWMSRKKPPKFNQKEESDDATTAIGERLKIDIERITNTTDESHNITGLRRSGKTTILEGITEQLTRKLQRDISEHNTLRIPVYIEGQTRGKAETPTAFVTKEVREKAMSIIEENEIDITLPENSTLSEMAFSLAERHILLTIIIDELCAMTDENHEEIEILMSELRELDQLLITQTVVSTDFESEYNPVRDGQQEDHFQTVYAPTLTEDETQAFAHIIANEMSKEDIEMSPSFIETLHQASQGVPYIAKTLIKGTISNYKQELFTHTDQTKILNYFHALVETNFGNIATVFENWINANQAAKDFLIKIAKEGTSKLHLNETGPLMPFIRMGLVDTVGRREFTIKNPLFKQWIIKKHIEPNKDKDQLEKEGIVSPGFSAAKILDRIAYEDKISTTIINDAASTDNRFGDALEEEIRKKFKNRATLRVEGGNIQTEENFYQTIRAQLELHYPELVNDPEISSAIETQNLGKIVQRIIELSQKKVVIIFTNADQVRNPEIVGSGFGGKIRSTLQRFRDKDFSIIFTTHNSMMHFSGSILNDNRGSQLYNICGYQEVKPENEANVRQYAQLKSLLVDTEKKIKNEIELYGSVRSQTITEKSRIEFKISQLLY